MLDEAFGRGRGLPSARGLVLCWLGCERVRELLADLNVREEMEVSAFSYNSYLLGLGLWYIQVRFEGG